MTFLNPCNIAFVIALICATLTSKPSAAFENFLTHQKGKLYDGEQEFRFVSWNIPNLHNIEDNMEFQGESVWRWPNEFEITDALETILQMRGKVARTYVISVKRENDSNGNPGHVLAPGEFNEEAFVALDRVLKIAREKGIRVIIPLVDNWHWWGGIRQYEGFRDKAKGTFWSDEQLMEDFKKTIAHVINRRNTLTGELYRDDKTIFGWETGNELDSTAEWTKQISAYIKSIDSNHLVIEGKSLHGIHEYFFEDPNIDVVTTHHYRNVNNNTAQHVADAIKTVRGRKAYFVGEFGFLPIEEAQKFLDTVINEGASGILYWSLRFHSRDGGFYWHDEPNGDAIFKAYHWPGFPEGDSFRENLVMPMLYEAAHRIDGKEVKPIPVPESPNLIEPKQCGVLSWQGSTGARSYAVERRLEQATDWERIADNVSDAAVQYGPLFVDETMVSGKSYFYRIIAKNESGESSPSQASGLLHAKEQFLLDELNDLNRVDSFDNTKLVTKGARSTNEDLSRLLMPPGSEVVYALKGDATSLKARIYGDNDKVTLSLLGSTDGKTYKPLEVKLKQGTVVGKDYGYLTPTLMEAEINTPSLRYLKLKNEIRSDQTAVQLSRLLIGYDNAATNKKTAERETKSNSDSARLEPSVLLFHKQNQTEGITSVQRAIDLGYDAVNVIVTMHCKLDDDRKVQSYGVIENSKFVELTEERLVTFEQSLTDTFAEATRNGLRLSIVAHLNSGGPIHDWRNFFEFDPLKKYGRFNYEEAVLAPIVNAMRNAKVDLTNETDVSLAGEMGKSVFGNAKSYDKILNSWRNAKVTENLSLGISFNFNRVDGDASLSSQQRKATNELLSKVDFIGFSNYSWFDLPVDQSDFQTTTELFVANMQAAGVVIPTSLPLHFTEIGIGGCIGEGEKTDSPSAAAKTPWYGTSRIANSPWNSPAMKKLRVDYYQGLLSFLKNQPASHIVNRAYIWSEGSWDPMGIREREFYDAEINDMILKHNSEVD